MGQSCTRLQATVCRAKSPAIGTQRGQRAPVRCQAVHSLPAAALLVFSALLPLSLWTAKIVETALLTLTGL